MAKLYFRYGAMGSSKTANAIMVAYNYKERGQRALMLKPRLEERDGVNQVRSRSGLCWECRYVEELPDIDVAAYDCVIVDEAQFLSRAQVEALTDIVDKHNVPVICYGLRTDFKGNVFEGSLWLMAWADTIEEIKTVCWCGHKAIFNARVTDDGRVIKSGEQIVLGGNDRYISLCRRHFREGMLGGVEIRKVESDRERYMELLLLADPEEDALSKYLHSGDMYAMFRDGRAVCEAIVAPRDAHTCELKNLATLESEQGKGHASRLMCYLFNVYAGKYDAMYVGTCAQRRGFYEKCGFKYAYTEYNFFVDNYSEPIYDLGIQCVDMLYFARNL